MLAGPPRRIPLPFVTLNIRFNGIGTMPANYKLIISACIVSRSTIASEWGFAR